MVHRYEGHAPVVWCTSGLPAHSTDSALQSHALLDRLLQRQESPASLHRLGALPSLDSACVMTFARHAQSLQGLAKWRECPVVCWKQQSWDGTNCCHAVSVVRPQGRMI